MQCFFVFLLSFSLDKILAAMTIAAERNNKERFAPIVEGLENHEAQQLQVRVAALSKKKRVRMLPFHTCHFTLLGPEHRWCEDPIGIAPFITFML